jgi:hypothetical protein
LFSKGKVVMKRALVGFVSAGILAVTLAAETANAQAYSPYGARRIYSAPANTPQIRGSVRRGAPPAAPYVNSDSPQATGGGSLGYNQNLWNW